MSHEPTGVDQCAVVAAVSEPERESAPSRAVLVVRFGWIAVLAGVVAPSMFIPQSENLSAGMVFIGLVAILVTALVFLRDEHQQERNHRWS